MNTGPKLLIVDDDPASVYAYQRVVRHMLPFSVNVLTAEDGATALKLASEEQPDVMLLDVNMPGLSGFQVVERLQADDSLKRIRVIFISGIASRSQDKVNGLIAGGGTTTSSSR